MPDTSTHRAAFRKLHESGCFVIPNPWDAGTFDGAEPFDRLNAMFQQPPRASQL